MVEVETDGNVEEIQTLDGEFSRALAMRRRIIVTY